MKKYGVKCGYCSIMGHTEDKCWKHGKDGKMPFATNNYLEVLVNDENATLEKLNCLCGTKHDIFTRTIIPRRHLLVESTDEETPDDHGIGHVDVNRNPTIRSKILTHFIKGMTSLSPIPRELESLENLVK
jgi:hypothetical protein